MAFSAVADGNLLFVGCNKGHLYNYNTMYSFGQRNLTKLTEAVSNLLIL